MDRNTKAKEAGRESHKEIFVVYSGGPRKPKTSFVFLSLQGNGLCVPLCSFFVALLCGIIERFSTNSTVRECAILATKEHKERGDWMDRNTKAKEAERESHKEIFVVSSGVPRNQQSFVFLSLQGNGLCVPLCSFFSALLCGIIERFSTNFTVRECAILTTKEHKERGDWMDRNTKAKEAERESHKEIFVVSSGGPRKPKTSFVFLSLQGNGLCVPFLAALLCGIIERFSTNSTVRECAILATKGHKERGDWMDRNTKAKEAGRESHKEIFVVYSGGPRKPKTNFVFLSLQGNGLCVPLCSFLARHSFVALPRAA